MTKQSIAEIIARAYRDGDAELLGSTDDPIPSYYMVRARQALDALQASGLAVVPVEADHDMTAAVVAPGEDRSEAARIYRTMIQAAKDAG